MPRSKRLPPELPRRRLHRALIRLGFEVARDLGPHTVYRHPDRRGMIISIPRHSKVSRRLVIGELENIGFAGEDLLRVY